MREYINNKKIKYISLAIILVICIFGGIFFFEYKPNKEIIPSKPDSVETAELRIINDNEHMVINDRKKMLILENMQEKEAKNILWSSSDESIAIVDEEGNVTGIGIGEAIITATINEEITAIAEVTIVETKIDVESIEITNLIKTINVGDSVVISYKLLPENTTETKVIWSSSNDSIATVDEKGMVVGKKEGKVIITAKTINDKKSEYEIEVQKKEGTDSEIIEDPTVLNFPSPTKEQYLLNVMNAYKERKSYIQYDMTALDYGIKEHCKYGVNSKCTCNFSCPNVGCKFSNGFDVYQRQFRAFRKNAPEYATSDDTKLFNCSTFVYNLYYEAFNYEIPTETAAYFSLNASDKRIVKQYKIKSSTNKNNIVTEIRENLKIGDLIVYKSSYGGHVIMYVGRNGDKDLFVHSYGLSVNYNYKNALSTGTINDKELTYNNYLNYSSDPKTNGIFVLGNKDTSDIMIFRPFNDSNLKVNDKTKYRYKMADTYIEKTVSVPKYANISEDDMIYYKITIKNNNNFSVKYEIKDIVSSYLEFSKGSSSNECYGNNDVFCTVTIKPNSAFDVKIAYKVKKGTNGKTIISKTYVNDMVINDLKTFIGNKLKDSQVNKLEQQLKQMMSTSPISGYTSVYKIDEGNYKYSYDKFDTNSYKCNGTECLYSFDKINFINYLYYKVLNIDIKLPSVDSIQKNFFDVVTENFGCGINTEVIWKLNTYQSSYISKMLVPTLYGGKYVTGFDVLFGDEKRVITFEPDQMMNGDIIIYQRNPNEKGTVVNAAMIYFNNFFYEFGSALVPKNGNKSEAVIFKYSARSKLDELFNERFFLVLRPSQGI